MSILTRAILNTKRKLGQTITLFGLVFLLGVLLSGAIFVRTAIEQTESNLREQLPSIATLEWELREQGGYLEGNVYLIEFPTLEMIESVGELPYVKDYDFRSGFTLFSEELNLVQPSMIQNLVSDEIIQANPDVINELESSTIRFRELGGYVEFFPIIGINNPNPTNLQAELISIESGRFMTELELHSKIPVAVVSNFFAEINHLELGSTFTLDHTIYNQAAMITEGTRAPFLYWHVDDFILAQQTFEFEVIGIFDVNKTRVHIDDETLESVVLGITDLYNQIYVPHTLLEEMERSFFSYRQMDRLALADFEGFAYDTGVTEENPLELHATFILYDSRDFNAFAEAASRVIPDAWYVVDTSGSFAPIRSAMDNVLWISQLIFWGGIVATLTILSLTITLFLHDRKYEIGIYRTLGETKTKIIYQILIEIFSVSIIAMILALFTGNVLSSHVSRQMLEQDLILQEQESAFVGFSDNIPFELTFFDPGPMSISEMMDSYNVTLDASSSLLFLTLGTVVILLSTILPLIYTMRLEPKKILLTQISQ